MVDEMVEESVFRQKKKQQDRTRYIICSGKGGQAYVVMWNCCSMFGRNHSSSCYSIVRNKQFLKQKRDNTKRKRRTDNMVTGMVVSTSIAIAIAVVVLFG